jgi:hypothetical protein
MIFQTEVQFWLDSGPDLLDSTKGFPDLAER